MSESSTFVGIDVHKEELVVCLLDGLTGKLAEATYPNTKRGRERLVRWSGRESSGPALSCYEAGQWGFELQRELVGLGLACEVIAPSLIPRRPGDRIKTDRRDARRLAELLSKDELTAVAPPTLRQEAARELCRSREAARKALHAARQQLVKLLVRWGHQWTGGKRWSQAYWRWVRSLRLGEAWAQSALDEAVLRVERREEEFARADAQVADLAAAEEFAGPVGRLRCYRGIDTLTAVQLVCELFEVRRFPSARDLMAYLGLVPSERSSGQKEQRGGITKTGNGQVRRLVVEAARQYKLRPSVSKLLQQRRAGQPAGALARADRAMGRLHSRYWKLVGGNKPEHVAVVAVARELAGFVWAELQAA